jgi:hypothetical protein
MTELKPKRSGAWAVVAGVAILVFAAIAIKRYYDTIGMPWTLITPGQHVEVATRMAELRNKGRLDEAVGLGLHSVKGQPGDDFIFQMIAETYFIHALQDKDQSGKWAKLGAEYSEKALDLNPTDIANIFNVGVKYMIAGDDLDTGGCEYYRKALMIFESLVPRLRGNQGETQGRTVRLAPFRKQNEEYVSRLKSRLRHCQPTSGQH